MKTWMIVLLTAVISPAVFADWRWIGPPAGSIEELRPDRSDPALWFAVNNGSLYRSTDGARTWKSAGLRNVGYQGLGEGEYLKGSSVTVTMGRVLVLRRSSRETFTEILMSRDHGKTFFRVADAPFVISKIIGHPSDPKILYSAADSARGILVSKNEGKTWTEFSNLPLPQSNHGSCAEEGVEDADVALSPFNPDQVFVSGVLDFRCGPESDEEKFFFKSNDGGKSWKVVVKESDARFEMDPAYPQRLFAIRDSQSLMILTPQGWQTASDGTSLQHVISVPRHAQELLALTVDFPVLPMRSTDSGHTWRKLNLDLQGQVATLAALDDSSRGVLGGTEGAGLYLRDEKQPWHPVNLGFRESMIEDVQGAGNFLYGLELKNFLFRNTGSGWTNLTFGMPGAGPFAISVDPRNSKHVVVLSKGIVVSNDGGNHWSKATLDSGAQLLGTEVAVDPTDSKIVYASKAGGRGLFKSTDGGNTFRTLPANFGSNGAQRMVKILVDPNDHRIIYFVIPFFGFFKSENGGASVTKVNDGISPPCAQCQSSTGIDLVPLAPADSYLAITMEGKIYRTNNGAKKWDVIGQGPAKKNVSRLFSADGMGQHLYSIAGVHPELFESVDGGRKWTRIADFPPDTEVYSLSNPKTVPLYAATNHGIFIRE